MRSFEQAGINSVVHKLLKRLHGYGCVNHPRTRSVCCTLFLWGRHNKKYSVALGPVNTETIKIGPKQPILWSRVCCIEICRSIILRLHYAYYVQPVYEYNSLVDCDWYEVSVYTTYVITITGLRNSLLRKIYNFNQ